jgi:hypothetical protein
VSETTVSRILRALGYRKLSARPRHHAQAAGAVDSFKNVWPARSASAFRDLGSAVCVNVSGLSATAVAKMEIRAPWSS